MENDITLNGEMTLQVRQVKDADMPNILTIEQDSFGKPWSRSDFDRQENALGLVAENDGQIVGFVVYEIRLGKIRLLNIAVADEYRRQCVGTHLIDALIVKLCPEKPRSIVVVVRETNDAAISFFAKLGFHSTKVLKGHYDDSPEDAYRMEWKLAGHREIASSDKRA